MFGRKKVSGQAHIEGVTLTGIGQDNDCLYAKTVLEDNPEYLEIVKKTKWSFFPRKSLILVTKLGKQRNLKHSSTGLIYMCYLLSYFEIERSSLEAYLRHCLRLQGEENSLHLELSLRVVNHGVQ